MKGVGFGGILRLSYSQVLTHSQLALSSRRIVALFQQLNRMKDSESVAVHVCAEDDQAERENRIDGDCRQEYEHVRPVGEVCEQKERNQKSDFDKSSAEESEF